MAGNAFIRFNKGKVPGESTQKILGESSWIEIGDWSWDIEAESSFLKGGGAAVGKAVPGSFSFTHFFDRSSPVIMTNIVKGVHFADVDVVMMKQTGEGALTPYFAIHLTQAFTTKVSTKGGEDGSVTQDFELVSKAVSFIYMAQDGTDGALKSSAEFQWDIALNTTGGACTAKLK
jgi:type VI secretion system secreted protein Hcp